MHIKINDKIYKEIKLADMSKEELIEYILQVEDLQTLEVFCKIELSDIAKTFTEGYVVSDTKASTRTSGPIPRGEPYQRSINGKSYTFSDREGAEKLYKANNIQVHLFTKKQRPQLIQHLLDKFPKVVDGISVTEQDISNLLDHRTPRNKQIIDAYANGIDTVGFQRPSGLSSAEDYFYCWLPIGFEGWPLCMQSNSSDGILYQCGSSSAHLAST